MPKWFMASIIYHSTINITMKRTIADQQVITQATVRKMMAAPRPDLGKVVRVL